MAKVPIAIWGASGHALSVSNIVRLQGQFEIAGYLDNVNPDRKGEVFNGRPVLGGFEVLHKLKQEGVNHIVLGFGHCKARLELAKFLKKNNFQIATLIHPSAVIADDAVVDEGTVILPGVVIGSKCRIGQYAIINNGAIISHGSIIGDGVHICPGVSMGGNVNIGTCSWIGIGSCIIDHAIIGDRSFIGAGSVVTKDIPKGVLAYGNPARVIHSISEPF
jgi:sugar O-acyltransferase (sialic acid O-acetyltransferase NeuD family)